MAQRAHPRRVNSAEYFDRYFALGVPVDDIADATVRQALREALADGGPTWSDVRGRALDPASTVPRRLRVIAKLAALSSDVPDGEAGRLARIAAHMAAEASDGAAFIGSERQTCLSWVAMQLERLPAGSEDPGVLFTDLVEATGDLVLVLRALTLARPGSGAPGNVVDGMAATAAEAALAAAMSNLRARDEAPLESVLSMLEFARGFGLADTAAAAIEAGLEAGEFAVEDVAARFLSIALHPETGEPSGMVGFEEQVLRSLVSEAAIRAAAPYDASAGFDPSDLSWANRRVAARPRLAALAGQSTPS